MATRDQPGVGWTVVLGGPLACMVEGYVEHAGLHRRAACRQLGMRTDAG